MSFRGRGGGGGGGRGFGGGRKLKMVAVCVIDFVNVVCNKKKTLPALTFHSFLLEEFRSKTSFLSYAS